MTEQYGYAGKILRVDLTTSQITEIPSSNYLPEYLGGRGLNAKIYWDEVMPEVKALDPENRLIFSVGLLAGTGALCAGRTACASKSPRLYPTNSYFDSSAGGRWGIELKYAGYDAIIVQGKAQKPVYLWINDEHIEIRDAAKLWGLTTRQTQEALMDEHGSSLQVASIGPAGENLVEVSIISLDSGAAFSNAGLGAVMGSKNLKAIAVRGTGRINVADPAKVLAINDQRRRLRSIKAGEKRVVNGKEIVGSWPMSYITNHIQYIPESQIRGEIPGGYVRTRKGACPGCLEMCKTKVQWADNSLPTGSAECTAFYGWSAPEILSGQTNGKLVWEWAMLVDALVSMSTRLGFSPPAWASLSSLMRQDPGQLYLSSICGTKLIKEEF
jgi:aldehyde:ferredoxin oxidoreductase